MNRIFAGLFVALCACGGGSTTTNTPQDLPHPDNANVAKTYPIHMARALRVGEKLHVVSDAEETRTTVMTRQGSVIDKKSELTRMHFDAVLTVESLDAKKDVLHGTYAVADLSSSGDKTKALLHQQKVDVTRAAHDDDAVVLVDGAPATPEMREALRLVLTFRTGGPSDDEIFGSQTPRAIGATWAIDGKRAQDDLVADQGAAMANATLDGDVTFVGLEQSQGHECIALKSEMHIVNIGVPAAPAGSRLIEGKATANFEGLFPTDDSLPRLTDKLKLAMKISLAVQGPNGTEIVVDVTGLNKRERHTTPL